MLYLCGLLNKTTMKNKVRIIIADDEGGTFLLVIKK